MALLVVILSLGVGGNAWADPGNGNGNGNGNSSSFVPPGQAKKDGGYAFGKPADAVGFANGDTSQAADSQAKVAETDNPDSGADAPAAKPGKSDHHEGNASTVGADDQTQPLSNADKNNTGKDNTSANGKCPGGPYCSTRDGSPSLNGNGGGHAYGKPCAGCVGKADNKNPHGQYPNWKQDGNNGYECDGNNGIGKTNPAHTGCTGTTPPPTDCRTDHSCPPPQCAKSDSCPKPPCSQTAAGCPTPCSDTTAGCPTSCSDTTAGCPTTCTGGMVSNDSGTCGCPKNMSEDANGNCYEVGVPVYICPSGMVMHANGTCHCPKGDTMIKGKCTPPDILGIQKTRPRPKTQVTTPQVAPAAAGLPNTGAGPGLGIYAMTGAGLLLFGGALMALRRKTVRR